MAIEIERKFLVIRHKLPALHNPTPIQQAYIPTTNNTTVRIRLAGQRALLTIKSRAVNLTRSEYEFPIPFEDAREMLDEVCSTNLVEKQRYLVPYAGLTWEIDVFHGSNDGLIIAEVELEQEDQQVDLPDWAGEEVSHDPRYNNHSLAMSPYSSWTS
ncbi:MAG: CYTH domain-containing protein [Gammaproteobacteria bacterium]|nr:CYTH domain-containing protein [Gammaproteobacteria bacterium]